MRRKSTGLRCMRASDRTIQRTLNRLRKLRLINRTMTWDSAGEAGVQTQPLMKAQ